MFATFSTRIGGIVAIAAVSLAVYGAIDYLDGVPPRPASIAEILLVTFFFLGWAGIAELSRLGRTAHARCLGLSLGLSMVTRLMFPAPPHWTPVAIAAIACWALLAACWYRWRNWRA